MCVYVCVCVCLRVCARACPCACVWRSWENPRLHQGLFERRVNVHAQREVHTHTHTLSLDHVVVARVQSTPLTLQLQQQRASQAIGLSPGGIQRTEHERVSVLMLRGGGGGEASFWFRSVHCGITKRMHLRMELRCCPRNQRAVGGQEGAGRRFRKEVSTKQ